MTERRTPEDETPLPAARPGFDTPGVRPADTPTVPLRTDEEHARREEAAAHQRELDAAAEAKLAEYRETTAEQDALDPFNRAEWSGGPLDGTTSRPAPMPREATTHEVTFAGVAVRYHRDVSRPQAWIAEEDIDPEELRATAAARAEAWAKALGDNQADT